MVIVLKAQSYHREDSENLKFIQITGFQDGIHGTWKVFYRNMVYFPRYHNRFVLTLGRRRRSYSTK